MSVDSISGRFHRLAFGPMSFWYVTNSTRDTVRSEIESLFVERLRAIGFEVIEPQAGVAICSQLADSIGGNFDPRAGRVDPEREAALNIRTIRALVDRYDPDGLIYWVIEGSGLAVVITDRGGYEVYRHKVGIGADAFPGPAAPARSRYNAAVEAVLDPFSKAARKQ